MLDTAKLQQLSKLKVLGKKLFHSGASGDYQSFVKGVAFDFMQLREYVEGDDVRFLDWNAYAKTGSLLTKETIPERDRAVIIVLDCSASNNYSSEKRLKSEIALDITYSLAWLACHNKDKVGLLAYGKENRYFLPCSKNRGQFLSIFDLAVDKMGKLQGSDLSGALEFLLNLKQRKSLVFYISDFEAPDFFEANRLWQALTKKHFVVPIFIKDKLEQRIEEDALIIDCQDLESGEIFTMETSSDLNNFLEEYFLSRELFFRKRQLNSLVITTQDDILTKMHLFFNQRSFL